MKKINVLDLPPEQITTLLRQKDDCKTIKLAGKERLYFLGGISFDVAEREDLDLGEVLQALSDLDFGEGDVGAVDNFNTALSWLLYVGFAPFGDDLSPAEIKLHLSTLSEDEALSVFGALEMEGVEEVLEEEGDEAGKPQSK